MVDLFEVFDKVFGILFALYQVLSHVSAEEAFGDNRR